MSDQRGRKAPATSPATSNAFGHFGRLRDHAKRAGLRRLISPPEHREFSDHLGERWRAVYAGESWSVYQKREGTFVHVASIVLGETACCYQLWVRVR